MAHLTIQLGSSVVVPFGGTSLAMRSRRGSGNACRVRWKALREAAAAADGVDSVFCAIQLREAKAMRPIITQSSTAAHEGVRK